MGGLCAIRSSNTFRLFWNESELTFGKSAYQKVEKFLYTFINFFAFVEHIAKNNLTVTHIQRDSRRSTCFVLGKITAAYICNPAVPDIFSIM